MLGGQRIGVAGATVEDSQFLVLDEPTSNLDVSVQAQMLRLLMDLHAKTGTPHLFVAHDMVVAQYASDSIAVMRARRWWKGAPPGTSSGNPCTRTPRTS
ncbi:MAG: hypothetical protein JRM73_05220 [Nitrososphaerota archaeon]|nr:hypothetical protein [Nitrososphaerota archaeon]